MLSFVALCIGAVGGYAQPGNIDPLFNPLGAGANGTVHAVKALPDGKVLIGGAFTQYNGAPAAYIARLNADGTLDNTFNTGTGPNGIVHAVAVQPNGRIVLGGAFTSVNGTGRDRMARLMPDGAIDPGFTPATLNTGYSWIADIEVQPDGRIVAARANTLVFDGCGSTTYPPVVRLNANGSADGTFSMASMCISFTLGWVNDVALRADGSLLIGGVFSTIGGVTRNGYAVLNSNGTLNAAVFSAATHDLGTVRSVAVNADGKMLIGGNDNWTFPGSTHLPRYNADGSTDATWTPGTGPNDPVTAVAVQPDGKVIIAGSFTQYNGTAVAGLARLNNNGTLDATFNPGSGPVSTVHELAVEAYGNVLIAGDLSNYAGTAIGGVTRVLTCTVGQACDDGDPNTSNDVLGADCACGSPVDAAKLSLKVLLEGPGITANDTMHDLLRSGGHVPLLEPYSAHPAFAHVGPGGGESVTPAVMAATGTSAITDWVFIELRDATDPTVVVATRSALLLRNGNVVDVDRLSPLSFPLFTGEYHVAVRHRSHLGAMTAGTYIFGSFPVSIDMTQLTLPVFGTQPLKTQSGFNYLWAGDVNADGQLKYTGANNDRDPILAQVGGTVPTATVTGYYSADVAMDGVVKYTGTANDRDKILVNIGGTVPTAVRNEQLP